MSGFKNQRSTGIGKQVGESQNHNPKRVSQCKLLGISKTVKLHKRLLPAEARDS